MNLAPRQKLLLAGVLLLALPAIAAVSGASATTAARATLGVTALVGLAAWWRRASPPATRFALPPRLHVVQRVGLSQRSGLALVEVDGRPWLVAHGDGYATLQPARTGPEVLP